MRQSFIAALALTAIGQVRANEPFNLPSVDCMSLTNPGVDVASCSNFPLWASIMAASGDYGWEAVEFTTTSGYKLNMLHILTDPSGDEETDQMFSTPVLMVHDIFRTVDDFFRVDANETENFYDGTGLRLPAALYQGGSLDIWMLERRGNLLSQGHTTLTDLTDAMQREQYFDYDMFDIGTEDIPKAIETIQSWRTDNAYTSEPVYYYAVGMGALEVAIALNNDPTLVGNAIVAHPNLLLNDEFITAGLIPSPEDLPEWPKYPKSRRLDDIDIAADGTERVGRSRRLKNGRGQLCRTGACSSSSESSMSPSPSPSPSPTTTAIRPGSRAYELASQGGQSDDSSNYGRNRSPSTVSCDTSKEDYETRHDEIRDMLSYGQYRQWYAHFRNLRRFFGEKFSDEWICDYNWEDLVDRALCKVDNTYAECQPKRQKYWTDNLTALYDAGIYAVYDQIHLGMSLAEITAYCDANQIENELYDNTCVPDPPTTVCEPEFVPNETCLALLSEQLRVDDYLNLRRRELFISNELPLMIGVVSLRYLDTIIQNVLRDNGVFCEWSSTYATDGWYLPCDMIDLTAIQGTFDAWFIKDDDRADVETNSELWREFVAGTVRTQTWNDYLTRGDMSGANEAFFTNMVKQDIIKDWNQDGM